MYFYLFCICTCNTFVFVYFLKENHLRLVFGEDMMGSVFDVEVDSSETEDRVHQAGVNFKLDKTNQI